MDEYCLQKSVPYYVLMLHKKLQKHKSCNNKSKGLNKGCVTVSHVLVLFNNNAPNCVAAFYHN